MFCSYFKESDWIFDTYIIVSRTGNGDSNASARGCKIVKARGGAPRCCSKLRWRAFLLKKEQFSLTSCVGYVKMRAAVENFFPSHSADLFKQAYPVFYSRVFSCTDFQGRSCTPFAGSMT
jgi:hypothetical protein